MAEKINRPDKNDNDDRLKGSKSDPQKTEMEGLKEGGKEPIVHADDKARDDEGKIDHSES